MLHSPASVLFTDDGIVAHMNGQEWAMRKRHILKVTHHRAAWMRDRRPRHILKLTDHRAALDRRWECETLHSIVFGLGNVVRTSNMK